METNAERTGSDRNARIGHAGLRVVLIRWAIRVGVIVGLTVAYQIWSPEPHDWLWSLVVLYAVAMLALRVAVWHLTKRKTVA